MKKLLTELKLNGEVNKVFLNLRTHSNIGSESEFGLMVVLNDAIKNNRKLFIINEKISSKPILANFKIKE